MNERVHMKAGKAFIWNGRRCTEEGCEFESFAEWAWRQHEAETGHETEPVTHLGFDPAVK